MKNLITFIILLISNSLFAQVGINTHTPNRLTELDIKNIVKGTDTIPKGIMIPRMTEKQRNSIDVSNITESNGLLIYNTDEDCYNYYNHDLEWKSLCGKYGKAKFTFNCNEVLPIGVYTEKKELDESHYLKIPVTVSSPGEYNIGGVTSNGYYFSASGQFLSAGTFNVVAKAYGKPNNVGENIVTLTNNNITITCDQAVKIGVLSSTSNYTINCTDTQVQGVYENGKTLNLTHKITINVNVISLGSYNISSNTVDGISFSGSGMFAKTGVQPVVLYGFGTPFNNTSKTITINSNSIGGNANSCSIVIRMIVLQKTILSLGSPSWAIHNITGIANMFNNVQNFGSTETSTFKTQKPIFLPKSGFIEGTITTTTIGDYISGKATGTGKPVDIVVIAYNTSMDLGAAKLLAEYVHNGGVVIMFSEFLGIGENLTFLKKVFDDISIKSVNTGNVRAAVLKLPNVNDEILNGAFGDIRGKYVGTDNCCEDVLTYIPPSEVDWSFSSLNYSETGGSASQTLGFKAKNYNLFWCGDGGFASSNNGLDYNTFPVYLTSSPEYKPSKKSYGLGTKIMVDNATFMANLLAWAIQQADFKGINSGK